MPSISLTIEKNGVANLIFDLPNEKINKLSAPVLNELEKALNVIDGNKAIRVLLISSAKKDIFVAGADINEIKDLNTEEDAFEKVLRGQEIISKIEKIKIPTIALINGACLGGGLELALACQYRIGVVNPKTSLGLPEVNLGIIPGFGGTQRLPKLIGLQEGLKMILSGKAVDAKKALKIGLVDTIMREEFLLESLSQFVTEILKSSEKNSYLISRSAARKKRFVFESILLGKFLIYRFAEKDLYEKTNGNYPAPLKALEVIKKTYRATYGAGGYRTELEAFCELVVGQVSKNLIQIFFTNEALKKDTGIGHEIEIHNIKNAALIGAGVMGGGIAWLFANKDFNIRIKDITQNAIAIGYNQVIKIFNQLKKIRKINQNEIDKKIANITTCLDFSGLSDIDIAVEAVVENLEVKKKILAEVEEKLIEQQPEKDVILVSNTSSLSITKIASVLQKPDCFAGMHFFNPVNRMPLVEVIYGEKTSEQTIASVVKLTKQLGKTPIVVKDVAGFLVNRILLPYMNEAAYILQEGSDVERIDLLIKDFGMPMGPFTLADVVGIDVGVKVSHSLFEAYGERMRVADILDEIYNNHKELLGQKSGKGFYLKSKQSAKRDNVVNPKINQIIAGIRSSKQIKQIQLGDIEIVDRCILTMVNEAAKCLEEGVVKNASYLDVAMIMGTGFPAFRGGVLRYADSCGISEIVRKLQNFNQQYGKRFEVSKLLLEMSDKEKKFY